MMDQNIDSGGTTVMAKILFPESFPTIELMMDMLQKTFQQSWKVDLDCDDIKEWLLNFNGQFYDVEDERRIALWLLCNFTYYNDDEINHLCRVLYNNLIHQVLLERQLKSEEELETFLSKTAFTSIGTASESGSMLLYHFRQEVGLSIEKFIFPTSICSKPECDNIVCIDDVMMSGGTSARFFYDNRDELTSKTVYYLTLLTSKDAIDKLSGLGISVITCTILDDRNKAFSDESLIFFKYPEIKEAAKRIAEGYGIMIEPKKSLGYKNGQYCFGFSYNIPNNSLPIFWSSNNGWKPIIGRKEKYQNARQEQRAYGYFI